MIDMKGWKLTLNTSLACLSYHFDLIFCPNSFYFLYVFLTIMFLHYKFQRKYLDLKMMLHNTVSFFSTTNYCFWERCQLDNGVGQAVKEWISVHLEDDLIVFRIRQCTYGALVCCLSQWIALFQHDWKVGSPRHWLPELLPSDGPLMAVSTLWHEYHPAACPGSWTLTISFK